MDKIAVINQKGGTGKTTTVINLGVALASLNQRVLLIDLDAQANLTYSFGITVKEAPGSIADVLQGKQTIQTILVKREGLDIAPSSLALTDVEVTLTNKIGREGILKDKLQGLKDYDYIFVDCPPALSVLTINALNYANEVLIPVQVEILALQGLNQLLNTIREVKGVLNKDLKVMGIIPSMFDNRRNLSQEVLQELEQYRRERIFKTVIRECVKIAEAPSFAKSVLAYAPGSNGAEDFLSLAREIIKLRG
jgi:chromosome partitioning protein